MASFVARFECSICQGTLEDASFVALGCGHCFHSICAFQWLERAQTCPSCRASAKKRHVRALNGIDAVQDDGAAASATPQPDQQQVGNSSQTLRGVGCCRAAALTTNGYQRPPAATGVNTQPNCVNLYQNSTFHSLSSSLLLLCCCCCLLVSMQLQAITQLQRQLTTAERQGQELAEAVQQLEGVQDELKRSLKVYKHRCVQHCLLRWAPTPRPTGQLWEAARVEQQGRQRRATVRKQC